jgi:hypothetical protein
VLSLFLVAHCMIEYCVFVEETAKEEREPCRHRAEDLGYRRAAGCIFEKERAERHDSLLLRILVCLRRS